MKYATLPIEIDSSKFRDQDSTVRYKLEFPSNYGQDIVGLKVFELGSKNQEYSIGLKNDNGIIQEPTYKEDWLRTTEYTREKPIEITNMAGRNLDIDIISVEPFTANFTLHFVFTVVESE